MGYGVKRKKSYLLQLLGEKTIKALDANFTDE